MTTDIRWQQRFQNYRLALAELLEGVELSHQRPLSKLEKQGMIQSFEYTHELAWKTLKDFLEDRGNSEIYGSKDATREAFQKGLIGDGHIWMEMIKSRNLSSHTYNKEIANRICEQTIHQYAPLLLALERRLLELIKNDNCANRT